MADSTDKLFREDHGESGFKFDDSVVGVFPNMIERSVPCYTSVNTMSAQLAASHIQESTRVYDLGASLLTTTRQIAELAPTAKVELVSIDNSSSMVAKSREILDSIGDSRIQVIESDVVTAPIENASVVIMNWTLQFVDPQFRQELLNRIFANLVKGGILIITEKIDTGGPGDFYYDQHVKFKLYNGYSQEEIDNKFSALNNVMIPDKYETHIARLNKAGFNTVYPWFRCLNWASFVAFR